MSKYLKFTAKDAHISHTCSQFFADGDVKEVQDGEAAQLLADWPHLFTEVKSDEVKPEPEKAAKPKADKSFKPKKDK